MSLLDELQRTDPAMKRWIGAGISTLFAVVAIMLWVGYLNSLVVAPAQTDEAATPDAGFSFGQSVRSEAVIVYHEIVGIFHK